MNYHGSLLIYLAFILLIPLLVGGGVMLRNRTRRNAHSGSSPGGTA